MSLRDLQAFALAFVDQNDSELSQVCFEIIKGNQMNSAINKDDLVNFCKKIALMSDIQVNDFYSITKLDPREEITKDQFIKVFPDVKELKFLQLVKEFTSGYTN